MKYTMKPMLAGVGIEWRLQELVVIESCSFFYSLSR
jgi:hypothetical protein